MLRNAQNVPQKSLLANRLDVVDANKSQLVGGETSYLQRNVYVARGKNTCRGVDQLVLNVHFLIILRGALNLPVLYGGAKGGQGRIGLALNT